MNRKNELINLDLRLSYDEAAKLKALASLCNKDINAYMLNILKNIKLSNRMKGGSFSSLFIACIIRDYSKSLRDIISASDTSSKDKCSLYLQELEHLLNSLYTFNLNVYVNKEVDHEK